METIFVVQPHCDLSQSYNELGTVREMNQKQAGIASFLATLPAFLLPLLPIVSTLHSVHPSKCAVWAAQCSLRFCALTAFEDVSMIRSLDPDSSLADNSLNRCLDDPKSTLDGLTPDKRDKTVDRFEPRTSSSETNVMTTGENGCAQGDRQHKYSKHLGNQSCGVSVGLWYLNGA